MALTADPPGALMKERLTKLTAQRTTWLKDTGETSKANNTEVARRKTSAAYLSTVAQQEVFLPLKAAMNAYSTALHSTASLLEELNAEHVDKKVAGALGEYEKNCVRPLTELAADRERAFAEARKAVEAHNAARLKVQSGPKLSDVEGKSLAARRCAHNTHVLFEETSQLFEYKRVADFKRFLQHQIMGEMAFHCAAIEGLTQALQAVGSVDPEVAMDALRDQLVHPATRPEDFEAAATGSSTPFTGFHVPADLQSPMGSAMASYNPATAVAFAAATSPSPARSPSPSPSPYTTGSAPSTLAQPPVSVSAEDAGRGGSTQAHYYHGGVALPGLSVPADAASPGPASAASAGRPSPAASTQPYVTAAAPPGAQYTLSSMPSPWATTPAGIQVPSAAPSPTVGYPSGYSGGPTSSQPSPSPKPTKTGFLGALGFGRRAPTPTPLASPSPSPSTNYTAGHGT